MAESLFFFLSFSILKKMAASHSPGLLYLDPAGSLCTFLDHMSRSRSDGFAESFFFKQSFAESCAPNLWFGVCIPSSTASLQGDEQETAAYTIQESGLCAGLARRALQLNICWRHACALLQSPN